MTREYFQKFLWALVAGGVLLWSGGANAACFTVSVVSGPVIVAYNPLDNSDTRQTFQIELHNDSCGTGAGEIGVSNTPVDSAGAAIGSPVQTGYDVQAANGSATVNFDQSVATLAQVSAGTVAEGQSADLTWTIDIAAHSIIDYDKRNFTIYVVGAMGGAYEYIPVNLQVDITAITQLSFAGAATTLTMDFGELSSNASQNIGVFAQATVPFDIVWTSENNGVLKNLGDANWQIPYTATLNGTVMGNSTVYTDTTGGGTQGASVSLPLTVTIGDASDKKAGTYRDIVTIKIQPH